MSFLDPTKLTKADWHLHASELRVESRCLIDGEFANAQDGSKFEIVNPATGQVIASAARGGAADVDAAVRAARKAFRSGVWSRMDPRDRMAVLYRFASLIRENAAQLALLDSLCMGKPISDLIGGDIPIAANTFQFFGETVDKIEGVVTATSSTALHYILRQPLGVVGAIVPWNYPVMMAAWKLAPALATGNTVVLKPAEQSPLSAVLLGRLFLEAGGPAGVLNVVPGLGEEAGKALALHMDVDKIGFTGSTEVGRLMLVYAGQSNMKRVTTECGGKTPQIFLPDLENLDTAVGYAVGGIFGGQGQVCNAGSRLLVHNSIRGDFIERFKQRTLQTVSSGDPLDPATTHGPLVTKSHQKRVLGYVSTGIREGAKLVFGDTATGDEGAACFVKPTLFDDVTNGMRIAQEEIFGPVASVIGFDSFDEAMSIANDSIYGLAASIWTKDVSLAHRFARDAEAGVLWVNCFDHGDMTQPWGGFKQSGQGRDKCLEALTTHTQTKSVWVHLGG